ncbi:MULTISPECIES: hypothetical protein [unclassified Bacillus (in: firmicutes)]|uniref:hypothetical protein n=1 Tax=Bacillus TaxID=1386 RepID=UPI0008402DA7|nr:MULTISPECIES: hypothetical protein [unclassified Bacillus (in: firmicutes)]MDN0191347.1 hypothetical protein [Bacillus sp. B.PNR1]MDN3032253.1 hypothetical protein [Bacillus sp. B.PNR2]OEI73647.1 hypothetical protein BG616_05345 [Bacillus subtilis]TXF71875.1 hypothetical protein FUA19_01015 [Bacillus subtilis]
METKSFHDTLIADGEGVTLLLRDNPEKAMHLYYGICLGIWLIYNLVATGSPGLPLTILVGGNLIYLIILKKKEKT